MSADAAPDRKHVRIGWALAAYVIAAWLAAAPAALADDRAANASQAIVLDAWRSWTLGYRAMQVGNFEDAITSLSRAAAGYDSADRLAEEVDVLIDLSGAYQALGHATLALRILDDRPAHVHAVDAARSPLPSAAATLFHGALPLAERLNDRKRITAAKNALGAVAMFSEDAERAEGYLNEALRTAQEDRDARAEARIQNNLGSLWTGRRPEQPMDSAQALSNYHRALAAYSEAIRIAGAVGERFLVAKARVNQGAAAAHNAQYGDAVAFDQGVFELLTALPDCYEKANLLLTLGRSEQLVSKALGTATASSRLASNAYQWAVSVCKNIHANRLASYARGFSGQLYEDRGDYAQALALTREAIRLAQLEQSADALYLWEWQTGRILRSQGDADGAIRAYVRSRDDIRGIRNDIALRFGNSNMRSSFHEVAGPIYYGLADLLLERSAKPLVRGTPHEQSDLAEARATIELGKLAELEEYFQDPCSNLYQRTVSQPADIDRIAREHAAAIVYFIALPDRLEILVTFGDGLHRFTSPVGSERLTKEVRALRSLLEQRTTNYWAPHARQLYDWLIGPMEVELSRQHVQTLVFVPDGALRTIPMAALRGPDHKFLIERYPIAVSPGLSLTVPKRASRMHVAVLESGLSVSRDEGRFPPLEYVEAELSAIHRLFGGIELLNPDFTLRNLQRHVRDDEFTIVHIASHGEFNGNSRRTFVVTYDAKLGLAGLERLIAPGKARGRPVELLTLSACETAKGDDRAALGLAGVAIKAGAASAMATLWSVNDDASAQLVGKFYEQLHDDPMASKADALRRAQIHLLAMQEYSHPYYWSPFLMIGNWL